MNELLTDAAVDLAGRIRSGEVTSREVIDTHIAQIERVNPSLNAIVVEMFDEARKAAAEADAQRCAGSAADLPLLGVPFTVKEMIGVRGMPQTGGVVARKDAIARDDAPLVARMRRAGAIPIGLTNVSEAGLWIESHNRVYGRTNNAYSPDHIAGGSSGGEAAIIGAGGSPIGIGADIGGSIRNPSFFNGIAGHKPTGRLLSSEGHWPPVPGDRGRYCVCGPMARRVRDLVTAMEIFSPDDDPDREPGAGPFRRAAGLLPADVTVYWFDHDGVTRPSAHLAARIEETAAGLADRGFTVRRWRPQRLFLGPLLWIGLVSASAPESVRELLGDGEPIALARQWWRFTRGSSDHAFYSLLMATLEGVGTSDGSLRRLRSLRDALRDRIESKLGDRAVLMCPVYPRSAPKHDVPLRTPLAFAYCGVFNVLELPSTAVPTGFCPDGLPLGVQIAGRRFADPLTLFVAEHVEALTGGWRPPG